MFLCDPNVLFWLPGVNHRRASLPGHSPTAVMWAAFLQLAEGRGGTKREQMGLGDYFLLHICVHVTIWYLMPSGLWDPNSQVLTQPTQTSEQTSLSRSFIAVIQCQNTHTYQIQGSNPTKCKAQSYK